MDDPRYKELMPGLWQVLRKREYGVGGLNTHMRNFCRPKNNEEYVKHLESLIHQHNGHVNCGECADLIQNRLQKKGLTAHNIRIQHKDINTGKVDPCSMHTFTVFGLKPDADPINPKKWGPSAVVVDGWANITKPAQDALREYKKIFCFDPNKHDIKFEIAENVFS